MIGFVQQVIQWVGSHPNFAGVFMAFVAFAESLAFVGLLVPGAILMFGAGALIAGGALRFWPIAAWAVGGAILGDGLSYGLGRYYGGWVRELWLVRRHPELLARAERFFRNHGGKSIILGRFVGPVRPVIPVVAGMLDMPPARFFVTNVLSALGWAPAYLLPGMAFGASLVLAGEVASRLALLLGALGVATWAIVWVVRFVYRQFEPRAERWGTRLMTWGRTHRRLAWLIGDLFDPVRPAIRALLLWVSLLAAAAWLFLWVMEDVVTQDSLVFAGQSVFHLLQGLRTAPGDAVMVALSELGDAAVITPVIFGPLLFLLWRRDWRDAVYLSAASGFGALAVVLLKTLLRFPRPIEVYSGVDAYSFPSGHATMSVVVYGFLAVLVASTLPRRARWYLYAATGLLIGSIAFSRIYLGVHWLADVAGGLSLGTVWVAVLAIASQRHMRDAPNRRGLGVVVLIVLVSAAGWHIAGKMKRDLVRYAVQHPVQKMATADWWGGGWKTLPAYRIDLEGDKEQPLTIQWAGELPTLRLALRDTGWVHPLPVTARTALHWLVPDATLDQLPVLPQLHAGQYDALRLVRPVGPGANDAARQAVIRLWPTGVRLQPGGIPLWVGTVTLQRSYRLPLLRFPRSVGEYDQMLAELETGLGANTILHRVRRPRDDSKQGKRWSGTVCLVRSPEGNADVLR